MKTICALIVVFGMLLPVTVAAQYTPDLPDSLKAEGDSLMVWLNAGTHANVTERLHYPPTWTKKQVAEDQAGLAKGLALITTDLGRLMDYGAFSGVTVNYEVSVAGGDIPYWDSVSPFRTRDRIYQGVFERFGRGFVVIRFAELNSRWDAQSILFWLDPAEDGSRDRAIDLLCKVANEQARQEGQAVPKNLREMVGKSLPDLSAANH